MRRGGRANGIPGQFSRRISGPASVHLGTEWKPVPAFSWRVGYRTDTLAGLSRLAGFTTGIGLRIRDQEFAYAWVPMGELGNTQYFSLRLRFGQEAADRHNLIKFDHRKKTKPAPHTNQEYETEPEQLMELLNENPLPRRKEGGTPGGPGAK